MKLPLYPRTQVLKRRKGVAALTGALLSVAMLGTTAARAATDTWDDQGDDDSLTLIVDDQSDLAPTVNDQSGVIVDDQADLAPIATDDLGLALADVAPEAAGLIAEATLIAPLKFTQVSTDEDKYLALAEDGTVWSWDDSAIGVEFGAAAPVQVMRSAGVPLTNIIQVAENSHWGSYAVDEDGTVWAWGSMGEFGNCGSTGTVLPTKLRGPDCVALLSNIREIVVGDDAVMAIEKGTGYVYAWGDNEVGILGDGTYTDRTTPGLVKGVGDIETLSGVSKLVFSYRHALALVGGKVYAWGQNEAGQLGDGTTATSLRPVAVTGLSGVPIKDIAVGFATSYALSNDGKLYAWGYNGNGEFGTNAPDYGPHPVPSLVVLPVSLASTNAGSSRFLAITSAGQGYGWGGWGYPLGIGCEPDTDCNPLSSPTPVPVAMTPTGTGYLSGVTAIDTSYSRVAVIANGQIYTWGHRSASMSELTGLPVLLTAPLVTVIEPEPITCPSGHHLNPSGTACVPDPATPPTNTNPPTNPNPPTTSNPPAPKQFASVSVTVSGTPKVGVKLTAKPSASPSASELTCRWLRGATTVSAAKTYTPVAADKGKVLKVECTARKVGYTDKVGSATTAKVAAGTLAGSVKITGTAKVGKTLKADISRIKPTGFTPTYQWYAGGKAISGAKSASYKVAAKYAGQKITVKVTAKAAGYETGQFDASGVKVAK